MARRLLVPVMIVLFFGAALIGCKTDSEPTYTVWALTMSYTQFSSQIGTMNDNTYDSGELTDGSFANLSALQTNDNKRVLTEDQLRNYFRDRGFSSTQASQLTVWLISVRHGMVVDRAGQTVSIIFK